MATLFKLTCILLFSIGSLSSFAQKNGVTGYGKVETIYVGSHFSGDLYLGAGGGVVVNDNLLFGVYLRALYTPYKYDYFESNQHQQDTTFSTANSPFSTTPTSISNTINNIESGINIGFNIMPDKPFQITFNGMLGLSSVSFSEITVQEDLNAPLGYSFYDNLYTMFGFNSAAEVSLQLKVGSFFKLGANFGYHFSVINGNTRDGLLLSTPTMFSGPYLGANIIFGSF